MRVCAFITAILICTALLQLKDAFGAILVSGTHFNAVEALFYTLHLVIRNA
jgi:hypothetical protein